MKNILITVLTMAMALAGAQGQVAISAGAARVGNPVEKPRRTILRLVGGNLSPSSRRNR